MASGELKTTWILRRMKRKPLSMLPWKLYNVLKATPEERRFDILTPNERLIGRLVCTEFGPRRSVLTTPWGEASIDPVKGGTRICINGRELVKLSGRLFKSGIRLTFHNGITMTFRPVKGKRNDIEFSDGEGLVWVQEEAGVLQGTLHGGELQPTMEEMRTMPARQRPRTIESDRYVQYRISTMGRLPVHEEEVARALTILAAIGCLATEV